MLTLRVTLGASASVFALMLMSSVALADGTSIGADVGDEPLIVSEEYPAPVDIGTEEEASPEEIKGECASDECGELVEEYPGSVPVELEGVDPIIYQNEAAGGPIVVRQNTDREAANTGNIPNLCDTAGPGWNWLCGAN